VNLILFSIYKHSTVPNKADNQSESALTSPVRSKNKHYRYTDSIGHS